MSDYEVILSQLRGQFEKQAGCLADDASDIGIRFQVIAAELTRLYEKMNNAQKQMFPDTADGEYLARHGAVRGITRKPAARATGRVNFRAKEAAAADIRIPAGTLAASSQNNLIFRTTAEAVIRKGTSATAAIAEASEPGPQSNLAPGLLDVLVTPIAGITSVENPDRLAGGAEQESEDSFRKRILESYRQISNGANLHYYEQFATSRSDIRYAKASFVSGAPNKINLYVENLTRTLPDSAISSLQAEVEKVRELNMKVTVLRPAKKQIIPEFLIRVDNLANASICSLMAGDAIAAAVQELGIGERFSPVLAGKSLLEVPGILDVSFSVPAAPIGIGAGEIAMLGGYHITEERA